MNTWFQKKEIHLGGTWMHPVTKKHHIIDFVVLGEGQRMFYTDVRVMRSTNCWSDHQMVRAKLRVKTIFSPRDKGKPTVPFVTYLLRNSAFKDNYRENLTEKPLAAPHDSESKAEQNWETLKSCILKARKETVGRAKKSQPDWFLESIDTLQPLIDVKNKAHNQMIQSSAIASCKEFRRHQRLVKVTMDRAKEEWIRRTAQEGEKAVKDGRTRWQSIRKLQMAHTGRRPSRTTAILKKDGELTKSPEEVRS